MSLRTIRVEGDEILRKSSKEIQVMTPRLHRLIHDMLDTMYENGGVGLAAVQVGILKRLVVIDTGDDPHVLINPEIIARSGSQTGPEGCLSIPGKSGTVTRAEQVTVRALNEDMEEYTLTGSGLLARAICHECDHLDGILYIDVMEGELVDDEEEYDEE